MNLIKLIKRLGIVCAGIFLLTICMIVFTQSKIYILILVSLSFISVVCCINIFIYRPIKRRDLMLNKIIEDGGWKECLNDGWAAQDLYLNNLCKIVQQCEKDMRHENSIKMLDKQSQINALQSQINPHFLYNTLESIRGQAIIEGVEDLAKMVEALSSFFRYSISQKGYLVTLRDEINNIRNYISIQNYRFNNKFKLTINIDNEENDVYDYYLPKLTIQPIVENAIFHGLETRADKGEVTIEITQTKQRLLITISDNGTGMDADKLELLNKKIRGEVSFDEKHVSRSTGIALANVNKRIKLIFGEDYGIKIYSTINLGTDVEITLPIMKDNMELL